MKILKGKKLADDILKQLKKQIAEKNSSPNWLAIILVGNDSAAKIYVDKKLEVAKKLKIKTQLFNFEEKSTTTQIVKKIKELNKNADFKGILVQLPLPSKINICKVLETIDPVKDVDWLTPLNIGKMTLGDPKAILGATPQAIIYLLENHQISLNGKKIALVGYGKTVGRLLLPLLIQKWATVTVCNRSTLDLQKHTQRADIIISATGWKNIINAKIVKPQAILVNAGCCQIKGKMYGDFDEENIKKVVKAYTPIFGWVGPLTIAFLFKNLVEKCGK